MNIVGSNDKLFVMLHICKLLWIKVSGKWLNVKVQLEFFFLKDSEYETVWLKYGIDLVDFFYLYECMYFFLAIYKKNTM